MNNLNNEIAMFINSWEECSRCNYMYKFSRLTCCNDNTFVCDECIEEHIMSNWIS